jgi:hypothetical protein
MRTLVICHHDAPLDREGLPRWLRSFSTYAGTLVIEEPRRRLRARIRREVARVGLWRFLDVVAFRVWHRLASAAGDERWERDELERLRARFPGEPSSDEPELIVASPNSGEAEAFVRDRRPDLVIARCKVLLKPAVFEIPPLGTFAMHPGICPEYRNAHGCFWAIANGDLDHVGMTLLKIDKGIDTGAVYGYFMVTPRPRDSHIVVQHRAVTDNFDAIRATLTAIAAATARPIDTTGRRSAVWGQPWMSAHLRMKVTGNRSQVTGRRQQVVNREHW